MAFSGCDPEVVQKYRDAHSIATAQQKGEAQTEQLRQGVTSYRSLVDALLEDQDTASGQQERPDQSG